MTHWWVTTHNLWNAALTSFAVAIPKWRLHMLSYGQFCMQNPCASVVTPSWDSAARHIWCACPEILSSCNCIKIWSNFSSPSLPWRWVAYRQRKRTSKDSAKHKIPRSPPRCLLFLLLELRFQRDSTESRFRKCSKWASATGFSCESDSNLKPLQSTAKKSQWRQNSTLCDLRACQNSVWEDQIQWL